MKNRRIAAFLSLGLLALLGAAQPASAGVYTDDLSKCLVSGTTPEQKAVLVNWMFSAMSLNPAVAKYVAIPEARRKQFNVDMAHLVYSLLTETCRKEMQAAVKYEGSEAIGAGFNVLGQVAGRELFSNPEVGKALSALNRYIDEDKLKAAMTETP